MTVEARISIWLNINVSHQVAEQLAKALSDAGVSVSLHVFDCGHRIPHELSRVAGCGKDAGWGFAKSKQAPHWFCFEHHEDGERYL
jgi:hypothetical protein